jgi:hypothetical protein
MNKKAQGLSYISQQHNSHLSLLIEWHIKIENVFFYISSFRKSKQRRVNKVRRGGRRDGTTSAGREVEKTWRKI